VNGTPQAYLVDKTEEATLIQSTGRDELNCISFPLPAENILDRRWSGNDSYDYEVNTCSGYPKLEDLRRFLQVLNDNPDVSIIIEMELLSLSHLYSYNTVSKYIEKMYEEVHYIPK
jgi:hypothetical protein